MIFLARLMMVLCFFAAPAFGWIMTRGLLAIRDDYGIGVCVFAAVAQMPIWYGLALLIDNREAQDRLRQPGQPDRAQR